MTVLPTELRTARGQCGRVFPMAGSDAAVSAFLARAKLGISCAGRRVPSRYGGRPRLCRSQRFWKGIAQQCQGLQ